MAVTSNNRATPQEKPAAADQELLPEFKVVVIFVPSQGATVDATAPVLLCKVCQKRQALTSEGHCVECQIEKDKRDLFG